MDERPVAVSIIEGSERIVPALLAFQKIPGWRRFAD
jgi:hypothetical protein